MNTIRRAKIAEGTVNRVVTASSKSGVRPATQKVEGMSNSSAHLAARGATDDVSNAGLTQLSDQRQGEILIRGSQGHTPKKSPSPLVVYSSSYKSNQEMKKKYGFEKTAFTSSLGGQQSSFSSGSGADVTRQAPEVYSPLFQIANLQLPRDRITMNAWNRNFFDTNPIVHNCINLHATYPISKINIKCKHKKVEQFFNDMIEEIDLVGILQNMALEYWKMGEVFPYAELDEERGIWKDIVIQNPDYIHVKSSVLSGESLISMRPDAALQRLVTSNNPADIQLRKQISEDVLYHVRKGNTIPLDNFHISHLKMTSSPYDNRGTSPIVSIYKDLMLYDKLRESKFAQADNLVNPITLISVGGTGEGEYHPTEGDLEQWRQTIEAAQYDKDFKIISHAGVKIERVGAAGAIIDISGDMTFIVDNILYGLMTPKAILIQEGASFNTASVGLEVLKQRYEAFRNMMAQWLVKKIFAPISEIQEFYEYKEGKKKLIVPTVDWNQMILFDMTDYINILNTLTAPDQAGNKKVSKSTLFRSLGLDVEEERRKIRKEMIEDEIARKETAIVQKMSISALRAIKEDSDIVEPTEEPLPGVPGAEAAPGATGAPGGLGGGLDLGLGTPPAGGGGLGGLDLGLGGPTPESPGAGAPPMPEPTPAAPAPTATPAPTGGPAPI